METRSVRPALSNSRGDKPAVVEPHALAADPDYGRSLQPQDSAKRRRVRKGTKSCWECKRRKIRCIYSSADEVTCLSCERRRIVCVSQDLPEELSPARIGNRHLSARISKVEDLMRVFLVGNDASATAQVEDELEQESSLPSDTPITRSRNTRPPDTRYPHQYGECRGRNTGVSSLLTPNSQITSEPSGSEPLMTPLFAALPCSEDIKILLEDSSRTYLYNELIYTQPLSKLTTMLYAKSHTKIDFPRHDTHPALLARCLLMFSITLQNPKRDRYLALSEPQDTIMRRCFTAATNWVTTKQGFQDTYEGLICVILEGVYEINCGNLRTAWSVFRRAMTAAQLMGLHRTPPPPLKRIDPKTDAQAEILWFRIVYMDQYLSLLLGLPQGTSDKSMLTCDKWQDENLQGRFERHLSVIASRILERNEHVFNTQHLATTQSIDAELLQVSKSMPVSFWRPVNFHQHALGEPDTYLETLRLGAQVYYYGLLIQLHLPYMVQIGHHAGDEYSRLTCVNASRDILSRFIAHRSFNPASTCSRPVDFFALLAAMTLLLAHLEAHQHPGTTNFLAHQRASDRAILDQMVERLHTISRLNDDVVTEKSALLIQQLLHIEADASEGTEYITTSVSDNDATHEDKAEGSELQLRIPYLGNVRITRQGIVSREALYRDVSSRFDPALQVSEPESSYGMCLNGQPTSHAKGTVSDTLLRGSILELELLENTGALPQSGNFSAIDTGADDWTFQGVDVAFFDNLMRGTSCLGADADGNDVSTAS